MIHLDNHHHLRHHLLLSHRYTFVNAWVPGLKAVARGPPPLGTVFSCYMCACMVGSVVYGALKRVCHALLGSTSIATCTDTFDRYIYVVTH